MTMQEEEEKKKKSYILLPSIDMNIFLKEKIKNQYVQV